MANMSLQISQILAGNTNMAALGKKNAPNGEDAILAGSVGFTDFQALIANLAKGGIKLNTLSSAGTAAQTGTGTTTATATTTEGKTPEELLASLNLSPEMLSVLKSLTPDQLVSIAQGNTELGAEITSILDALSQLANTGDLYEIIKDPELAAALAGISSQIKTLQANGEIAVTAPFAETLKSALAKTQTKAVSTSLDTTFSDTLAVTETAQTSTADTAASEEPASQTISIAELTPEEFDAFKKIAYSDIAPFLTQPRLVRIDANTVMKVAQGPAFLNDDGTQDTAMTAIAGLVPVLVKAVQNAGLTGTVAPATGMGAKIAAQFTATNADGAIIMPQAQIAQTPAPANIGSLLVTVTPTATQKTGLDGMATGLENGLMDTGFAPSSDTAPSFTDALQVTADQTTGKNATLPLISAKTAADPHPSTHLVSTVLQRAAANNTSGNAAEREFVIQLDPPSIGRLKITLQFSQDNKVTAKLLAERPETVALLQKDAALLEKALSGNGFDASAPGAITFDLAQDNSFSGNSGGNSGQNNQNKDTGEELGTELADIENVMAIFVDPATGLTHVNILI